jgi:DNA-binding transcriptional regulator YbjK
MAASRRVPNDPTRAARILDAALQIIAVDGTRKVTHRRVAEAAGVPLGSVTYYFGDIEHLITNAFERLATTVGAPPERLHAAEDLEAVIVALIALATGPDRPATWQDAAGFEMFLYARQVPAVAALVTRWFTSYRELLARHMPAERAELVLALIDGLLLHDDLDRRGIPRDLIERGIRVLLAPAPTPTGRN